MLEALTADRAAFSAHAETLAGTDPAFARFYAETVDATETEDLAALTPDSFAAILRTSFARFGQRGEAPHLISIWTPEGETPSGVQVLDVYVEDMPFLLDSVLGALRAEGLGIRLIAHPILAVECSEDGWHFHDGDANPETLAYESFVHIHFDPVGDAETLARLEAELEAVLKDVRIVVDSWRPMLERLRELVQAYRRIAVQSRQADLAEALHFLAWLADHNFTFLGMREYRLTGTGDGTGLEPLPETGLGILQDPDYRFLRSGSEYVEMTPQHVGFLTRPEPLLVTKANRRGHVHSRAHMDYVGAKLYDSAGALTGELRILGLFTSQSLHQPHDEVPFIRRKIASVMRRSGFDPKSHAGKALMAALDSFPRDELFQIPETDLFTFAAEIATLPDRPRLKVLPRLDPFDNYVSVMVFVPRERYSADTRADIGRHLALRYGGRVTEYTPFFPEGDMVRVHFLIGRAGGDTPQPTRRELETEIAGILQTFGERLGQAARDPDAVAAWKEAFPADYQLHYNYETALADIDIIATLSDAGRLAVRFFTAPTGTLVLKFYHQGEPIALSDRVPLLESFGFRVVDETTYTLTPAGLPAVVLHDMVVALPENAGFDSAVDAGRLEAAILSVWDGRAESDAFSQLVLGAGLRSEEAALFRAYGHYMRQIGIGFSQRYLADTLGRHPAATQALFRLFQVRLDPGFDGDREAETERLRAEIDTLLDQVASLDEDRIIRHYRNLVSETMRTSFFQRGADGEPRPVLALKLHSPGIVGLPLPKPAKEIFVCSPRVEGVHLRFGDIARGGIRWSDRPEDFRTEVLGLAKAQQVKNAIIVPVGAKGGFVPKKLPPGGDRQAIAEEALAAYKLFIGAMIDLTDSYDGDVLVPPPATVRTDGDDPYLVVAADKGTSSFSNEANALAIEHHFWLGDAFASGGRTGYDHKTMGITARGAWEAVKRHFREMNRDIQNEAFTAIGIGDMSGDVFGNGMLLSRKTRLVAAFDHRDIFIDPDPDAELGYMERKRLFDRPGSSWQDYDTMMISAGGGVYSRSAKSIPLSVEAQDALGIAAETITPADLIRAILMAEVDLIWFGGIGTYVRASTETDVEVGDRANDGIRVTADRLRAKVVGEGANLGLTQRGRIEFAVKGGCINTDAIDNSAGVNSSDLEVNIKIALDALVRAGVMDEKTRNALLAGLTDEVAGLCLRNTYLQSLALSLAERDGATGLADNQVLIKALEQSGHLDRAVAFLPDDAALADRLAEGRGLTRPELAELLATAKNTLYADLLLSPVPDDPYLSTELFRYFPDALKERVPHAIESHRLRREIIATVLSNAMINRGGPSYVAALVSATSAGPAEIARAFAAARDSYDIVALNAEIDALDTRVDGAVQLALYAEVKRVLVSETRWFLSNVEFTGGLSEVIARYRAGIETVHGLLARLMPPEIAQTTADRMAGFVDGDTPRDLARRIAELSALSLATDVVLVAEKRGGSIEETTEAFFRIVALFGLGRITGAGDHIGLSDRFDRLAYDRELSNLVRAVRELTGAVLDAGEGPVADRFSAWHSARDKEIDRIVTMIDELIKGELSVSKLSVAAGLLSDLIRG